MFNYTMVTLLAVAACFVLVSTIGDVSGSFASVAATLPSK